MICDKIENLEKYVGCHPRFAAAIPFLKELMEQDSLANGRHDMPNCDEVNAIYANVSHYTTDPNKTLMQMENHHSYIDIQIILEGEEIIYLPGVGTHPITKEYDAAADYELMSMDADTCTRLNLKGGMFAIFFAGELHAPGIAYGGKASQISKIVGKIKQ